MAEQKVKTGKTAGAVKTAGTGIGAVKQSAPKKTARTAVEAEPKKAKPAAAKAVVAAAASKPATKRAPRKTAGDADKAIDQPVACSSEQRYRMVETAAYFIAERNGFHGDAAEHWQVAELEIAQLLGE